MSALVSRGRPSAGVLAAAAVLALALRLLFSLAYWTNQPLTRDEREYLSLARGIALGRGFNYDIPTLVDITDPFGRAPGYPMFLALVGGGRDVPTQVPTSVKVAQSIVGAIGVVLLGWLAARLAGPRAGAAVALIASAYPPLVWIAAYGYSEALAWPLGIAVVLLFDRAVISDSAFSPALTAAAGLCAGLLTLVRPSSLLFAGLAALWLLGRRRLALAGVFVLGVAFVVGPWTARNYRQYGRFVAVATEGGVTFWTGNHPLAIGEGDLAANPDIKRDALRLRAEHPELSEQQMEPVYYREAFRWIRTHPARWLVLEVKKAFYLAVPIGPSYRVHSTRFYVASFVSYAAILPAALVGVWQLGRRRWRSPGMWLLAASAVMACLVFFPQERFRIPVIDPVLIVCAGGLCGATQRE